MKTLVLVVCVILLYSLNVNYCRGESLLGGWAVGGNVSINLLLNLYIFCTMSNVHTGNEIGNVLILNRSNFL